MVGATEPSSFNSFLNKYLNIPGIKQSKHIHYIS